MLQTEANSSNFSELTIAGMACLIALAALGLAIWEGHQQRRHNRLSVAPKLRIDCVVDSNSKFFGLVLSNCGFGPAIVRSFGFTIDGEALDGSRLQDAASLLSVEGILTWAFPDSEDIIKPGEDIPLFGTYPSSRATSELERIKTSIKRIGVSVVYGSIYGESYTVSAIGRDIRSLVNVSLPDTKVGDTHNPAPQADG